MPSLAVSLSDVSYDLGELVQRAEELEKEPESRGKEKRKEALARIVQKIFAYHILPESYQTADLIQNSTYATNLTLEDGSMDSKPLRLSILGTSIPPRLRINMLVDVMKGDIKAKNGERDFLGVLVISSWVMYQVLSIKSVTLCYPLHRSSKRHFSCPKFSLSS